MSRLKAKQVGEFVTKRGYVLGKCALCGKWSFAGEKSCPKCHAEFRGMWYER